MDPIESDKQVELAVELVEQGAPAEQVGLDIEGHRVALVDEVVLMVTMEHVVPDDKVNPKQDHRVVLVAQSFRHTERMAAAVVHEVFPVVDTFSP